MKSVLKITALILVIILATMFAACQIKPENPVDIIDDDSNTDNESDILDADSYVDYAKDVKFDYDIHPELIDNGLFWMMYDEVEGKVIGINVNDSERVSALGTALVDPNKPTIINIHGVQLGSFQWADAFTMIYDANIMVVPPDVFGYEGVVNMNKIWLDCGYNVMCYMYHRFADEYTFGKNNIISNKIIEAKIWSVDGPQKMAYRLRNGSFSAVYDTNGNIKGTPQYPELEYSLVEYFVGDYIRAFDSVEGLADNEIRITCHSMGCTLQLAGAALLSGLIRTGMVDSSYLPDRITVLDGYLGAPPTDNEMTNKAFTNNEFTVRWTGKKPTHAGTSELYLDCVKQLVNGYDAAIEFYIDLNGFVPQLSGEWFDKIREYCANTYYDLEFPGMLNDHNAIRELYHASIMSETPPLDITEEGVTAYALSAKSSIATIKERRGYEYLLTQGKNSGNSDDHGFIRIK